MYFDGEKEGCYNDPLFKQVGNSKQIVEVFFGKLCEVQQITGCVKMFKHITSRHKYNI